MRYIEIIFKLGFLGLAIYFLSIQTVVSPLFDLFLIVCIVLGLVLLINKHASYNFKQTKKDLKMRQIEGGVLIVFAVITSTFGL